MHATSVPTPWEAYILNGVYIIKNLTISYSSSFQHVLHMLEFKHMLAHAVNVSAYGLMLAHAGWCHSHVSIPERVGTYKLVLL